MPDHISLWDLLLTIRKSFDQYVNLRPITLLKGAPCPLKDVRREDIDMLFVRENSEGEYAGSGSWLFKGKPNEVVIQDGVFSRTGCERIIRYAFELARKRTSISKANALNYSMVFWDQIFEEVSREYPDVETHSYLVDAASMLMVKDPRRFEIVVTSNLFGDILTDLGAAIAGGIRKGYIHRCLSRFTVLPRISPGRGRPTLLRPSGRPARCWISSAMRKWEAGSCPQSRLS